MENIALSVCIYGLNSHFKCSFQHILETKQENVFLRSPSFVCFCRFSLKCPYSKKPILHRKISVYTPFSLTLHLNFHPKILVFANLLRKIIHDNVRLAFWYPRIFYLVLLWRSDYFSISLYIIETLFCGILRKIFIIFYDYWHCDFC